MKAAELIPLPDRVVQPDAGRWSRARAPTSWRPQSRRLGIRLGRLTDAISGASVQADLHTMTDGNERVLKMQTPVAQLEPTAQLILEAVTMRAAALHQDNQ